MLLGTLLRRFVGNRDGGVGPMLALAVLPLFGIVGAAIDYSRAASTRTAMQASLDASALMLSKDAQTIPDLAQKASDAFKANFTRPEAYDVQVASQFSQPAEGTFSLKLTASAKVNTLFSKLLGQSTTLKVREVGLCRTIVVDPAAHRHVRGPSCSVANQPGP